jgi:single-stranded DNA-binding protein
MKFCKKGDPVLVEGELEDRRFTGKDNEEKKMVCIRAKEVHFLSSKSSTDSKPPSQDDVAISPENREALNRILGRE